MEYDTIMMNEWRKAQRLGLATYQLGCGMYGWGVGLAAPCCYLPGVKVPALVTMSKVVYPPAPGFLTRPVDKSQFPVGFEWNLPDA